MGGGQDKNNGNWVNGFCPVGFWLHVTINLHGNFATAWVCNHSFQSIDRSMTWPHVGIEWKENRGEWRAKCACGSADCISTSLVKEERNLSVQSPLQCCVCRPRKEQCGRLEFWGNLKERFSLEAKRKRVEVKDHRRLVSCMVACALHVQLNGDAGCRLEAWHRNRLSLRCMRR
jgi:hypothetical protein